MGLVSGGIGCALGVGILGCCFVGGRFSSVGFGVWGVGF